MTHGGAGERGGKGGVSRAKAFGMRHLRACCVFVLRVAYSKEQQPSRPYHSSHVLKG